MCHLYCVKCITHIPTEAMKELNPIVATSILQISAALLFTPSVTTKPSVVQNFGGSSATNATHIRTDAEIVCPTAQSFYDDENLFVVVSAVKVVTNSILAIIKSAKLRDRNTNYFDLLDGFLQLHEDIGHWNLSPT